MPTTTSYGTYSLANGGSCISVEDDVAGYLGEWVTSYDVPAIAADIRTRINRVLAGTGIELWGNEFYAPAYPEASEIVAMRALADSNPDTDLEAAPPAAAIAAAIAQLDMAVIAADHEADGR